MYRLGKALSVPDGYNTSINGVRESGVVGWLNPGEWVLAGVAYIHESRVETQYHGHLLVSLPLNKYGKVAVDFCSDQGATKEPSPS